MDQTVTRLPELLRHAFHDNVDLTTTEIQQRVAPLDLSPPLRRLVGAMPDGRYDREQAATVLERIQREEGMWRDESRTSQAEVAAAMATYSADGQVDDATGNEAGPEQAYGDGAVPEHAEDEPDPDTEQGRRGRRPPEGRIGPH